jgi:hypothetical protein
MRRAVGRKARPLSLTKMGRKRLRLKVSAVGARLRATAPAA